MAKSAVSKLFSALANDRKKRCLSSEDRRQLLSVVEPVISTVPFSPSWCLSLIFWLGLFPFLLPSRAASPEKKERIVTPGLNVVWRKALIYFFLLCVKTKKNVVKQWKGTRAATSTGMRLNRLLLMPPPLPPIGGENYFVLVLAREIQCI